MAQTDSTASYRITLDGVANLEDLPVREVAAFLDAIPTLVAIGAAEVLGRATPTRGRFEAPIEIASQVRLVALSAGSLVAEILPAPAKPLTDAIGLDAETLSERALGLLFDVAAGDAARHSALGQGVVAFFDRFAAGRPAGAIRVQQPHIDGAREVVIDAERREVIRRQVEAATVAPVSTRDVTGRLFEANLETRSGQVRTPSGERVDVQFGVEHDQTIRDLLGNRAALKGEVTYDPRTNRAKSVRVRQILTGTQLGLDFGDVEFWGDRPVLELIQEAGGVPVKDPGDLELHGVSDRDWTALYEALGLGE